MRNYISLKFILLLFVLYGQINAQTKKSDLLTITDSAVISKITKELPAFKNIDISSKATIEITHGNKQKLILEIPENLKEYYKLIVDNETLKLKYTGPDLKKNILKNTFGIKLYIILNTFEKISLSGGSNLIGKGTFVCNNIKFDISDSSILNLNINAKKLEVTLSGASKLVLKGNITDSAILDASGVSSINTSELIIKKGSVEVSGASEAKINSSINLNIDVSEDSKIKYKI